MRMDATPPPVGIAMVIPPTPRRSTPEIRAYLATEEAILEVCDRVAEGTSLIDIAKERGWRYGDLKRGIEACPSGAQHLAEAMKARDEYMVERILDEIRALALSDLAGAYDEDGRLLPFSKIPEKVRRALSSVESDEIWAGRGDERQAIGSTKKVRMYDKLRALELLGKQVQMFVERHEVSGTLTLGALVKASMAPEENPTNVEAATAARARAIQEAVVTEVKVVPPQEDI